MPELPEVETTLQGIQPHLLNATITQFQLWQGSLRWQVPADIATHLIGRTISGLYRRGKYIIIEFDRSPNSIIVHLGMSGNLKILTKHINKAKHDHWQMECGDILLRYHDPRRFGALLYHIEQTPHPLLQKLGPEPLLLASNIKAEQPTFDAQYLFNRCATSKRAIKSVIMDSSIVVGIGNIYAAEALFLSKIHPQIEAKQLSIEQCEQLVISIQQVLTQAIEQG